MAQINRFELIKKLRKVKNKDIERYSFKGQERYAKVVSVYDGDTLDLVFYQDEEMDDLVRYKCRMDRYNAPELREGKKGIISRNYLAHLCMGGDKKDGRSKSFFDEIYKWSKDQLEDKLEANNNLVYVEFAKKGKYGREVVTLYQTATRGNPPEPSMEPSINDMMQKIIDIL